MTAPFIFISLVFMGMLPFEKAESYERADSLLISLNTHDSLLTLNGVQVSHFPMGEIEAVLGKPDRVKKVQRMERWERFGYGDSPPYSTMIEVTDHYYLYDRLGILLLAKGSRSDNPHPDEMIIYFADRVFDNTAPLAFVPEHPFSGRVSINGELLDPEAKLVPEEISYRSDSLALFRVKLGPASIAGTIDRLYSLEGSPYLMFYLDEPGRQRISYLSVKLPRP